jgi:hypothetical protein
MSFQLEVFNNSSICKFLKITHQIVDHLNTLDFQKCFVWISCRCDVLELCFTKNFKKISLTPKGLWVPYMEFRAFGQAVVNANFFWNFWNFLRLYIWMVAFQWDATRHIWTHGSKVMRFLRFQPKLGHAVSHCQCSRICPNLPKTAKIYQLAWGTLKCHQ